MANKTQPVDEYLAGLPEDKRAALEELRKTIRDVVPGAEERISYGLPAFRFEGRMLVGYGATAKHCALYPHEFHYGRGLPGRSERLFHRQGHDPLSGGRPPAGGSRSEAGRGADCGESGATNSTSALHLNNEPR